MIQGAMKAYKMFSGNNEGESAGSGNFFDNISMIDAWLLNVDGQEGFSFRLIVSKCSEDVRHVQAV
jgi:hypothetical protein